MKNSIKYILQRTLGFRSYLYFFAKYKIRTLKNDSKENEFFTFLGMLEDGKGAVLDIGANLGIMTVHLAEKLPNETIIAVEPMPDNRCPMPDNRFSITEVRSPITDNRLPMPDDR